MRVVFGWCHGGGAVRCLSWQATATHGGLFVSWAVEIVAGVLACGARRFMRDCVVTGSCCCKDG